jgi:AraC family transcriptional regulator
MGETLGDFLRRRRLEWSAHALLADRRETVLATALDCGFASGEVFARAFRQHFGMTPTDWRNGGDTQWRKTQQARRKKYQGKATIRRQRLVHPRRMDLRLKRNPNHRRLL